jgi:hypothetical protein
VVTADAPRGLKLGGCHLISQPHVDLIFWTSWDTEGFDCGRSARRFPTYAQLRELEKVDYS